MVVVGRAAAAVEGRTKMARQPDNRARRNVGVFGMRAWTVLVVLVVVVVVVVV